jgi:hypothetical protein
MDNIAQDWFYWNHKGEHVFNPDPNMYANAPRW